MLAKSIWQLHEKMMSTTLTYKKPIQTPKSKDAIILDIDKRVSS